jgi:hypothetical protein
LFRGDYDLIRLSRPGLQIDGSAGLPLNEQCATLRQVFAEPRSTIEARLRDDMYPAFCESMGSK